MKGKSISIKLIAFFSLGILVIAAFLGVSSATVAKNILRGNVALASKQTLAESQKGLSIYYQSLSQSVNLLTRKAELKRIFDTEYSEQQEENIALSIDSITAALKTTGGAVRGYFAAETGDYIEVFGVMENDKMKYKSNILSGHDLTKEEWYTSSLQNEERKGVFAYYNPRVDAQTGTDIITVSQCLKSKNEIIGVIAIDIDIIKLKDFVENIKLLNTGHVFLTDEEGNILTDPTNGGEGEVKSISETDFWLDTVGSLPGESVSGNYQLDSGSSYVTSIGDEITGWRLYGVIGEDEVHTSLLSLYTIIAAVTCLALLAGAILAIVLGRFIRKKMVLLQEGVAIIAKGDFSHKLNIPGQDEFHDLGENMNQMTDRVAELLRNINTTSHELFDASEHIFKIEQRTQEVTSNTSIAMQEIASGNNSLAENTQNVSLQVEALAHQLDDSSHLVREVADMSTQTQHLSSQGFELLASLGEKSKQTQNYSSISQEIFGQMTDSIGKINFISDAIIQITEQTSLLSLNASIEAARAGESGKGFAVVAEEIRKLSDASKNSTDEIKSIVDEINGKSQEATKALDETQNILHEEATAIVNAQEVFKDILAAIEQFTQNIGHMARLNETMVTSKNVVVASTEDMAAISEETASSSEEILASTTEVEHAMEELGHMTKKLNDLADELTSNIKRFKL